MQKWFDEEKANTEPPTLYDIVSAILHKPDRHTLTNLKEGAKILSFLQGNKIMDLKDLENKLRDMIDRQFDIRNELKPVDRRTKDLKEHFKQANYYKEYRGHKAQYDKLKAECKTLEKSTGLFAKRKTEKARAAVNEYYETNRPQITLYNTAEQYFKDHLQKHFDPKKPLPIKQWKAEYAELLSQKAVLNDKYKKVKEDTREVEIIRREVENIVRAERPKQQTRTQGMEI